MPTEQTPKERGGQENTRRKSVEGQRVTPEMEKELRGAALERIRGKLQRFDNWRSKSLSSNIRF